MALLLAMIVAEDDKDDKDGVSLTAFKSTLKNVVISNKIDV